jgi:hypothetical protein
MEKYNNLELIQKYFRDELNPEEQEVFQQLHQDPGFREELAEFEFLHDLLEAGTLMEEEEAIMGIAATEPGLNEPPPGPAGQGSLSKHPPGTQQDGKIASKPTVSHQQPKLQLRRTRVIRYAMATSVLLLLVIGLIFYLNTRPSWQVPLESTAPLPTNAPLVATISYQEESDNPVRDLEIPDTTFTVKIYPSVKGYHLHYLFRVSDTLRLYGKFNPKDLMLQHNESRMEYRLTYKDNTYLLKRNKAISPLIPAEK